MREHRERPHELRLDLPAAHSAERMARAVLRKFATAEGVAKREIETLELVASELLSNVVDQGGGEPKDVAHLVSKTDPPDLEDERGRGFFLLTGMLESLTVAKSADGRGLVFRAVRGMDGR